MQFESFTVKSTLHVWLWILFGMLSCFFVGSITAAPVQEENKLDHRVAPYSFQPRNGDPVQGELGSFAVLENRQIKSAKRITLKYIRLPSTNKNPGFPIVYLAGGPGGSGTAAGRGKRFIMFQRLRELGDVILFDQRGTGMSHQLPAGASWKIPADAIATRKVYEEAALKAFQESLEIWNRENVDLAAYNTESSADDLADLCTVLGTPKIRIVGISYGTHLGLSFMRRHPDRLDRIVLAGVEGPNHTLKMPNDQQALLEQIQRWIDSDPKASAAYPNFVGTTRKLLQHLRQEPHTIRSADKESVITEFDIQYMLAAFLRGPEQFRSAPKMIYEMHEGNFRTASYIVPQFRSGEFRAMSIAMDIASGSTQERLDQLEQQAKETVLGDAINFPLNVVLSNGGDVSKWDLGDEFRANVVSDIPTLAVSGTADGRTPPGNAEQVLETLSKGQHLIIEGAGHSDPLFLSSPKIVDSIVAFLNGDEINTDPIVLPPIKFIAPR